MAHLLQGSSVNGGMLSDTYLVMSKKMRLSSVQDLVSLIRDAGRGSWLFSCDVTRGLITSYP